VLFPLPEERLLSVTDGFVFLPSAWILSS